MLSGDKVVDTIKKTCNFCGKDATKICSKCNIVYYCNRDCQRNDWKTHKKDCKINIEEGCGSQDSDEKGKPKYIMEIDKILSENSKVLSDNFNIVSYIHLYNMRSSLHINKVCDTFCNIFGMVQCIPKLFELSLKTELRGIFSLNYLPNIKTLTITDHNNLFDKKYCELIEEEDTNGTISIFFDILLNKNDINTIFKRDVIKEKKNVKIKIPFEYKKNSNISFFDYKLNFGNSDPNDIIEIKNLDIEFNPLNTNEKFLNHYLKFLRNNKYNDFMTFFTKYSQNCKKCHSNCYSDIECNDKITCHVNKKDTLENLLDQYFYKEDICNYCRQTKEVYLTKKINGEYVSWFHNGKDNFYYLQKSDDITDPVRSIKYLINLPNFIVIELNRIRYCSENQEIQNNYCEIDIPMYNLDMSKYLLKELNIKSSTKYDLRFMINYQPIISQNLNYEEYASTPNSRFISYGKSLHDNKWYQIDVCNPTIFRCKELKKCLRYKSKSCVTLIYVKQD